MGWLFDNVTTAAPRIPRVQRIACSRIHYCQTAGGNSPDKRRRNRGLLHGEGPPIDVERSGWGGYRVIDGNDRLYYARLAGRKTIRARVWD